MVSCSSCGMVGGLMYHPFWVCVLFRNGINPYDAEVYPELAAFLEQQNRRVFGNQERSLPEPSEALSRGVAQPVTITVRPEVARFAEMMEAKLQKNDHKEHWRNLSLLQLLSLLGDEYQELVEAVDADDLEATWKEAVDVGNFAMMIADTTLERR